MIARPVEQALEGGVGRPGHMSHPVPVIPGQDLIPPSDFESVARVGNARPAPVVEGRSGPIRLFVYANDLLVHGVHDPAYGVGA